MLQNEAGASAQVGIVPAGGVGRVQEYLAHKACGVYMSTSLIRRGACTGVPCSQGVGRVQGYLAHDHVSGQVGSVPAGGVGRVRRRHSFKSNVSPDQNAAQLSTAFGTGSGSGRDVGCTLAASSLLLRLLRP